ncbi:MAG: hypothetical protein ACPGQR_04715 [Marinirhabdus sp.]
MFCLIVILPFTVIFGYFHTGWDQGTASLGSTLLKFAIVALPLGFLYVQALFYFYKKEVIAKIDTLKLTIANNKNEKEYINMELDSDFYVRLIDRAANNTNKTLQVIVKGNKKRCLIFSSGKKLMDDNQEFINFEQFKLALEANLEGPKTTTAVKKRGRFVSKKYTVQS